MQAIVTKYHCSPTTGQGRVSARASAGKMYVTWDSRKDIEGNHDAAALALAKKLDWQGRLAVGTLPTGENVYTFVTHSFRRVGKLRVVR